MHQHQTPGKWWTHQSVSIETTAAQQQLKSKCARRSHLSWARTSFTSSMCHRLLPCSKHDRLGRLVRHLLLRNGSRYRVRHKTIIRDNIKTKNKCRKLILIHLLLWFNESNKLDSPNLVAQWWEVPPRIKENGRNKFVWSYRRSCHKYNKKT